MHRALLTDERIGKGRHASLLIATHPSSRVPPALSFAEQPILLRNGMAVLFAMTETRHMGSSAMIAFYVMIGGTALIGLYLGISFRVPALIAATACFVIVASWACLLAGVSVSSTTIFTLCGLPALQGFYLLGVFASYVVLGRLPKRSPLKASGLGQDRGQRPNVRYALSL